MRANSTTERQITMTATNRCFIPAFNTRKRIWYYIKRRPISCLAHAPPTPASNHPRWVSTKRTERHVQGPGGIYFTKKNKLQEVPVVLPRLTESPRGNTTEPSPHPLPLFGIESPSGTGTYFMIAAAVRPKSRYAPSFRLPKDGGGAPIGSAGRW